jgi:glycosyltransferase involved in cell wall biosynthesis
MRISIVVPTLNEEGFLSELLDSVRSQDFTDYQVIVADAHSSDATVALATGHGAAVVEGGIPAVGRNAGAARATGEFLFFLDADVLLPHGFLRDAYEELCSRGLELATCEFRPISDRPLDWLVTRFSNLFVRLFMPLDPKAFGFCLFVRRSLFERVGGFDPSILFGEDSEFVARASRLSHLHFLKSVHLYVSVRRFEKEGRLRYLSKAIRYNLRRMFRGEIRWEELEYEFGAFQNGAAPGGSAPEGQPQQVEELLGHLEGTSVPRRWLRAVRALYGRLAKRFPALGRRRERRRR